MALKFDQLILKNWRNFREVDVDLAERVFVMGPNAAGKTNLLDAFRFLREIGQPDGSLVGALKARGGIAHLRSLHARQESNVRVEVRVTIDGERWGYALELAGTKTKPLKIVKERVTMGDQILLNRPLPNDREDPRLLEQTHLEQLSQNSKFRRLADGLASIKHVHVVPQVAKSTIRSDEIALRDAPGSDFIDELALLPPKTQRGALGRIQKILKKAVPQFSELRVERDELGKPHLEAKYKHWRPKGSWQNEADFSDGTLRMIGFLWAILEGDGPLLLEEPELSLHRDVVRQLPRLIARATAISGRQVIVSTHAEEMLGDQGVGPEEVLILQPTEEDTRVHRASEDSQLLQATEAGVPLAKLVTGKTRPKDIEGLAVAALEESA